jgi:microcystin-dependent protein
LESPKRCSKAKFIQSFYLTHSIFLVMNEAYIGSIVMFAGNFAPRDWAFCDGSLLSIAQNTALFSILGTTYGGDGRQTFALPDLRGRVPLSSGQGPGLSNYSLGQMGGAETETITTNQMPAHTHGLNINAQVQVSTQAASTDEPGGSFLTTTGNNFYAGSGTAGQNLGGVSASGATTPAGGNAPISLLQPYTTINYIICLYGIFPSRN